MKMFVEEKPDIVVANGEVLITQKGEITDGHRSLVMSIDTAKRLAIEILKELL